MWRLRSYLRPYVGALVIMATTAIVGVFVALAIPLVTKAIIDGPITDGDSGAILPLGLLAMALGITEAALDPDPALGAGARRPRLRDRGPQRPLPAHAGAADGVPRPLAERAAAVAGHRRPQRDPPLHGLRAALPGHQHPAADRGDDRAAPHVLAARPRRGRLGRPDDLAEQAVRAEVRRRLASCPGPARRRRHRRRGGRGRLPRGQVVRAACATCEDKFDDRTKTLYDTSIEKVRLSARFWTIPRDHPERQPGHRLLLGALAVGRDASPPAHWSRSSS